MMKISLSKIVDVLFLIMFIYFTSVQFNDSDSLLWIVVYALAGILAFISFIGKPVKMPARFLTTGLIIYLLFNTHLLTDWLNAGKPAFIDYEATFIKEAEQMRELLGTLIVLLVSLYYGFLKRRSP
ncbi:MAG: hypothetical protein HKN67_10265 [Saprospiraceae bacterium]|nr:hypothetical protein [Saprospiraceae bacterium]